ncbi:hypothetical protein ACLOJK_033178 [Asimina triloba]
MHISKRVHPSDVADCSTSSGVRRHPPVIVLHDADSNSSSNNPSSSAPVRRLPLKHQWKPVRSSAHEAPLRPTAVSLEPVFAGSHGRLPEEEGAPYYGASAAYSDNVHTHAFCVLQRCTRFGAPSAAYLFWYFLICHLISCHDVSNGPHLSQSVNDISSGPHISQSVDDISSGPHISQSVDDIRSGLHIS